MRSLLVFLVFGFIVLLACFIGSFTIHLYEMPNQSMEPLVNRGDVLAEIPVFFTGGFHRGSVVAFQVPYDRGQNSVSRIVGLPGDHIQVLAGHLLVNDRSVFEPYLRITKHAFGIDFPASPNLLIDNSEIRRLQNIMYGEMVSDGIFTVPEGYYFVLGDNRGVSLDSRVYGPIPQNSIIGRPIFVYSTKTAGTSRRLLTSADLAVN